MRKFRLIARQTFVQAAWRSIICQYQFPISRVDYVALSRPGDLHSAKRGNFTLQLIVRHVASRRAATWSFALLAHRWQSRGNKHRSGTEATKSVAYTYGPMKYQYISRRPSLWVVNGTRQKWACQSRSSKRPFVHGTFESREWSMRLTIKRLSYMNVAACRACILLIIVQLFHIVYFEGRFYSVSNL